jgi:undecaprenyl diphosphate synthase
MLQSTSPSASPAGTGLHVAVIMDGNGRWAAARGRPRATGHAAGVTALRRIAEAAPLHGITTLTVYAFSADNWNRPRTEVSALMTLLRRSLAIEVDRCIRNDVRLSIVGRRDRLPNSLVRAIESAEDATVSGRRLWLRVAVDYSARDSMLRAAAKWTQPQPPTREEFGLLLAAADMSPAAPEVDLLIRTGGEQRLSDFLLWESAYAELYFTPRMWPDFDAADLGRAIADFRRRDRRFGALPQAAAG